MSLSECETKKCKYGKLSCIYYFLKGGVDQQKTITSISFKGPLSTERHCIQWNNNFRYMKIQPKLNFQSDCYDKQCKVPLQKQLFDFHARLTKQNFSSETTEASQSCNKKKKTITRGISSKLTIQILSSPNRFSRQGSNESRLFSRSIFVDRRRS